VFFFWREAEAMRVGLFFFSVHSRSLSGFIVYRNVARRGVLLLRPGGSAFYGTEGCL
jgi:hypothetical protein